MKDQATSADQADESSAETEQNKAPVPTDPAYVIVALRSFCGDCAAIREMHDVIGPVLSERVKDLDQGFSELNPNPATLGEGVTLEVGEEWVRKFMKIAGGFRRRARAVMLNDERAIIGLVTCLEELFSHLATAFYSCKPDALAGLGKKIDYADLLKYSSMEEVVAGLMGREVSALSRDSHYDQLKFLDETLKLGLCDTFDEWNKLAEICARRNLYVHSGGKVNSTYLRIAGPYLADTNMDCPALGDQLLLADGYIDDAYSCVLEAGIQAGVASLRRLFSKKLSMADSVLADIGFEFLTDEDWSLAERVHRYGHSTPAKWLSSDEYSKIFLVNRCIALNQLGRTGETRRALDEVDWSSVSRKFVLARQVLCDEFEAAGQTMRQTNDDDVNEYAFRTWPLFREFRKSPEFREAFEILFGKAYEPSVAEVNSSPS